MSLEPHRAEVEGCGARPAPGPGLGVSSCCSGTKSMLWGLGIVRVVGTEITAVDCLIPQLRATRSALDTLEEPDQLAS